MDVQFKSKAYEKFISTGSTAGINQSFAKKLRAIYHTFSSAIELNDISSVKYLEFHELKGDRKTSMLSASMVHGGLSSRPMEKRCMTLT